MRLGRTSRGTVCDRSEFPITYTIWWAEGGNLLDGGVHYVADRLHAMRNSPGETWRVSKISLISSHELLVKVVYILQPLSIDLIVFFSQGTAGQRAVKLSEKCCTSTRASLWDRQDLQDESQSDSRLMTVPGEVARR
jgi:hypothetical protein